jgi:hypothetical protein
MTLGHPVRPQQTQICRWKYLGLPLVDGKELKFSKSRMMDRVDVFTCPRRSLKLSELSLWTVYSQAAFISYLKRSNIFNDHRSGIQLDMNTIARDM